MPAKKKVNMEKFNIEVFLRYEIKNKNKIINILLGNLRKPQNLSSNDSKKTFSRSEKILISHDNDITMEPQEAVKKKQSTNNTGNKSRLSKWDNSKRSQDNGIAIVNLENSTTTENVELQNISNIRNNLRTYNVNNDNIVILGDSKMKTVKNAEKEKQGCESNGFLRSNNSVQGKLHQTNTLKKYK